MQLFRCEIIKQGWCYESVEVRTHIVAEDADAARSIFCGQFGFRKNKKGMRITPIPLTHSKVVAKTREELIPEKSYLHWLGEYDTSHYGNVTRFYCSKCNREVRSGQTYCHCGASLIFDKKSLSAR